MKWGTIWPSSLLAVLFVALEYPLWTCTISYGALGSPWTSQRKLKYREETRSLWYHGFNNYMSYAFPLDELSPLSCTGKGPDWENPGNHVLNDVTGNFSLTLIDVLDTLVVLDDAKGFDQAVRNVIDWVSFDVNTRPQVFETTIRVLGGLLSGHIFASQPNQTFFLPWYRGQLLTMAHDLGKRMLPAFTTPTGIPFARLNLRHGVLRGESIETCTAGAGSLIIEFATLSRLTGDDRFEKAAYKAFFAIWNRKSDIGLVGNGINLWTGNWISPEVAGIGAGVDSFYEYALKWYVLSGEVEFLDVWHEAYAAVMRYARSPDGYWYRTVNMHTGDPAYTTVDSLSAFWPGLQVLGGDLQNAIKSHLIYWNIWKRHSGLPEVWDTTFMQAASFEYPLRPEFVESTWYLYRATRDTFYLDVGERILRDLIIRAKVECGLAGIKDLRTNARDNRMESFALSETLKYLYLLFDEANRLHSDDSNYVFTTEGHILTLPQSTLKPLSAVRRKMRRVENHQCPVYEPARTLFSGKEGLVQGVGSRTDIDYVRYLVGLRPQPGDEAQWSPYEWCLAPEAQLFSYEFILSAKGQLVDEDPNPSSQKLREVPDGYLLQNITGIRAQMVSRLDGKGYDITKLGPHAVRTGQLVYINDSSLGFAKVEAVDVQGWHYREADVQLRFLIDMRDEMLRVPIDTPEAPTGLVVKAYTAIFGGDPTAPRSEEHPLPFARENGIPLVRDNSNALGCDSYQDDLSGAAVLVWRGECAFLEKLLRAKEAGAVGVIVVSDEDFPINPSAGTDELLDAGDISDVILLLLTNSAGQLITALMDMADRYDMGQVSVVLEEPDKKDRGRTVTESSDKDESKSIPRILFINGHAILNTRLLV